MEHMGASSSSDRDDSQCNSFFVSLDASMSCRSMRWVTVPHGCASALPPLCTFVGNLFFLSIPYPPSSVS